MSMLTNWLQRNGVLNEDPRKLVRVLLHLYRQHGERHTDVLELARGIAARHQRLLEQLTTGATPAHQELVEQRTFMATAMAALAGERKAAQQIQSGVQRLEQRTRPWEEL